MKRQMELGALERKETQEQKKRRTSAQRPSTDPI